MKNKIASPSKVLLWLNTESFQTCYKCKVYRRAELLSSTISVAGTSRQKYKPLFAITSSSGSTKEAFLQNPPPSPSIAELSFNLHYQPRQPSTFCWNPCLIISRGTPQALPSGSYLFAPDYASEQYSLWFFLAPVCSRESCQINAFLIILWLLALL